MSTKVNYDLNNGVKHVIETSKAGISSSNVKMSKSEIKAQKANIKKHTIHDDAKALSTAIYIINNAEMNLRTGVRPTDVYNSFYKQLTPYTDIQNNNEVFFTVSGYVLQHVVNGRSVITRLSNSINREISKTDRPDDDVNAGNYANLHRDAMTLANITAKSARHLVDNKLYVLDTKSNKVIPIDEHNVFERLLDKLSNTLKANKKIRDQIKRLRQQIKPIK